MISRRKFLTALAAVPVAPVLLRGMSWAAPTAEELEEMPLSELKGKSVYTAEVPPGTILPYVGENCPPGYLPCDGRTVPVVAFQRLHEAIGDAYGSKPARRFRLRKFNVPDLRSRPVAAIRADERATAAGHRPAYLDFRYVIRT